jgi:hypothetical protein
MDINSISDTNLSNFQGAESFTTGVQANNFGHYSLFSGYQEYNGDKLGASLNEINRSSKLKIVSRSSSELQYSPKTFNKKIKYPSSGLENVYRNSIMLVRDIVTPEGSIRSESSRSITGDINLLIRLANRSIRRLQEKSGKLMRKVKKSSAVNKILKSVKGKINKIQSIADRQIARIRSSVTRKNMSQAQALIKKIQDRATSKIAEIKSSPEVKKLLSKVTSKIRKIESSIKNKTSPSKVSVKVSPRVIKQIRDIKDSKVGSTLNKIKSGLLSEASKLASSVKSESSKRSTPVSSVVSKLTPSNITPVLKSPRRVSPRSPGSPRSPRSPRRVSSKFPRSPKSPRRVSSKFPRSPKSPRRVSSEFPRSPRSPRRVSSKFPRSPKSPRRVSSKFPRSPRSPRRVLSKSPRRVSSKSPTSSIFSTGSSKVSVRKNINKIFTPSSVKTTASTKELKKLVENTKVKINKSTDLQNARSLLARNILKGGSNRSTDSINRAKTELSAKLRKIKQSPSVQEAKRIVSSKIKKLEQSPSFEKAKQILNVRKNETLKDMLKRTDEKVLKIQLDVAKKLMNIKNKKLSPKQQAFLDKVRKMKKALNIVSPKLSPKMKWTPNCKCNRCSCRKGSCRCSKKSCSCPKSRRSSKSPKSPNFKKPTTPQTIMKDAINMLLIKPRKTSVRSGKSGSFVRSGKSGSSVRSGKSGSSVRSGKSGSSVRSGKRGSSLKGGKSTPNPMWVEYNRLGKTKWNELTVSFQTLFKSLGNIRNIEGKYRNIKGYKNQLNKYTPNENKDYRSNLKLSISLLKKIYSLSPYVYSLNFGRPQLLSPTQQEMVRLNPATLSENQALLHKEMLELLALLNPNVKKLLVANPFIEQPKFLKVIKVSTPKRVSKGSPRRCSCKKGSKKCSCKRFVSPRERVNNEIKKLTPSVINAIRSLSPKQIKKIRTYDSYDFSPKTINFLNKFKPNVVKSVRELSMHVIDHIKHTRSLTPSEILKKLSPRQVAQFKKLSPNLQNKIRMMSGKISPKSYKMLISGKLDLVPEESIEEARRMSEKTVNYIMKLSDDLSLRSASPKAREILKKHSVKMVNILRKLSPKTMMYIRKVRQTPKYVKEIIKSIHPKTRNLIRNLSVSKISNIRNILKKPVQELTPKERQLISCMPKDTLSAIKKIAPVALLHVRNLSVRPSVKEIVRKVPVQVKNNIKSLDTANINKIREICQLPAGIQNKQQKDFLAEFPANVIKTLCKLSPAALRNIKSPPKINIKKEACALACNIRSEIKGMSDIVINKIREISNLPKAVLTSDQKKFLLSYNPEIVNTIVELPKKAINYIKKGKCDPPVDNVKNTIKVLSPKIQNTIKKLDMAVIKKIKDICKKAKKSKEDNDFLNDFPQKVVKSICLLPTRGIQMIQKLPIKVVRKTPKVTPSVHCGKGFTYDNKRKRCIGLSPKISKSPTSTPKLRPTPTSTPKSTPKLTPKVGKPTKPISSPPKVKVSRSKAVIKVAEPMKCPTGQIMLNGKCSKISLTPPKGVLPGRPPVVKVTPKVTPKPASNYNDALRLQKLANEEKARAAAIKAKANADALEAAAKSKAAELENKKRAKAKAKAENDAKLAADAKKKADEITKRANEAAKRAKEALARAKSEADKKAAQDAIDRARAVQKKAEEATKKANAAFKKALEEFNKRAAAAMKAAQEAAARKLAQEKAAAAAKARAAEEKARNEAAARSAAEAAANRAAEIKKKAEAAAKAANELRKKAEEAAKNAAEAIRRAKAAADKARAERALRDAEAARKKAEAEENSRKAAEAVRRAKAAADKARAERALRDAEAARKKAEAEENSRKAAEAVRRAKTAADKARAEQALRAAEAARKKAQAEEKARKEAEAVRRAKAAADRARAEKALKDAEAARKKAEAEEKARREAEAARRAKAAADRARAEKALKDAEAARKKAEEDRQRALAVAKKAKEQEEKAKAAAKAKKEAEEAARKAAEARALAEEKARRLAAEQAATGYVYQGCFNDSGNRAIRRYTGNVSNKEQCQARAVAAGMDTFGLQYFGECWIGNHNQESKFDKYGRFSGHCGPLGGGWNNQVYYKKKGENPKDFEMYGPWIGRNIPVQSIRKLNNNENVYITFDAPYTKMVSQSGAAKYYVGNTNQFHPNNWNSYGNAGTNYIIRKAGSAPPHARIIRAFYGIGGRGRDVTPWVQNGFNHFRNSGGRWRGGAWATNWAWGDPVPGIYKYLYIDYFPPNSNTLRTSVTGEGGFRPYNNLV